MYPYVTKNGARTGRVTYAVTSGGTTALTYQEGK
jgi:hypothetical protein